MKKALAILMIFALVASVAVAEVSIGAWGRGIFVPVANSGASGEDSSSMVGVSWGDTQRIGFTIAGNSDNVGFVIDGNVDGQMTGDPTAAAFGAGDNQFIWVKPMDMVTIRMGNIYDDTLRGNAAFGAFNWVRAFASWEGEDVTFSRIGINRDVNGFEVAVQPMDALYAALFLYDLDNLSQNMLKRMQFALGYSIDGIGQIKGQVYMHGGTPDIDGVIEDNQTTVELAFNYTGMENLFVEAGFMMNTNKDADADETKKLSVYANYVVDAAKIHFMGIYNLKESDNQMQFGAGLDYDLGDGVGVAADVRFFDEKWTGGDSKITFFAGVTKGFSNGKIGAGVQVASAADTGYAIPVVLEYWF